MKSKMFGSLLCCLVIGQIFGADAQLIPLVPVPNLAKKETCLSGVLKTAARANASWMALAAANVWLLKSGRYPTNIGELILPLTLTAFGIGSAFESVIAQNSRIEAYGRVDRDNNVSDEDIIARREGEKIRAKQNILARLATENNIRLAQWPAVELTEQEKNDVRESINRDRELAAEQPSKGEIITARLSSLFGVIGTVAAACWGLK